MKLEGNSVNGGVLILKDDLSDITYFSQEIGETIEDKEIWP